MRKYLALAAVALGLTVAGCKGGDSGYSYVELVDDFVYRLNFALGYDVEVVKYYAEQYDYIVVYDYDYDSYDAYYIGDYMPQDDINAYVNYWNSSFFYDLSYIGNNLYQDPFTGYIFNQDRVFLRDSLKSAGVREKDTLTRMSSHLVQSFNLPQASAKKIAKAALMQNMMQRQGAGEEKYREMAKALTGTTLEQWQAANGNPLAIEKLKETTARSLQMSTDDLNRFFGKLMTRQGQLDL